MRDSVKRIGEKNSYFSSPLADMSFLFVKNQVIQVNGHIIAFLHTIHPFQKTYLTVYVQDAKKSTGIC